MNNNNFLLYLPTVYCVKNQYQIIFITKEAGAGAVLINGKRYTDNVCGVVRTASRIHRICINSEILNEAKKYTVEFKLIPDRKPYFPETVSTEYAEFSFRPLPSDRDINCYVLADTHSNVTEPTEVGRYFRDELDLLILGGDIGNKLIDEDNILTVAKLSEGLAKGELPVIYMRGNHDTRGVFAEFLPEYVGTDHGLTYFPIRLGKLWFVLLDQGEDKLDDHPEYGDIADYEDFRNNQAEMLEYLIENSKKEYMADGVEVRIGLCHIPFTVGATPFEKTDSRWTSLLNKMGLNVFISGHTHRCSFHESGVSSRETDKPNFPTAICSSINKNDLSTFVGTAITISSKDIHIRFTDIEHNVLDEHIIDIP